MIPHDVTNVHEDESLIFYDKGNSMMTVHIRVVTVVEFHHVTGE